MKKFYRNIIEWPWAIFYVIVVTLAFPFAYSYLGVKWCVGWVKNYLDESENEYQKSLLEQRKYEKRG